MTRPRLLDLFCGAGGAAMGYHRAGFDVVGVDINPQPNYPFEFHQADAMGWLAMLADCAAAGDARDSGRASLGFDAVHASPPCQAYANVTSWRGSKFLHPDLLPEVRRLLDEIGLPYVIENVPGAPMHPTYILCGSMFGLPIRRHRWFLMNPPVMALVPSCAHKPSDLAFEHKNERAYADAMGCDWMTAVEGRQAIPPAYTEWIGRQLLASLGAAA